MFIVFIEVPRADRIVVTFALFILSLIILGSLMLTGYNYLQELTAFKYTPQNSPILIALPIFSGVEIILCLFIFLCNDRFFLLAYLVVNVN